MYKDFFALTELPFSIVPSSRYIFLSGRHREAMNHLQAGLAGGGGFALLTGEVGTGKTTVSKALLSVLKNNVKSGLLLNPTYTNHDLLEAICDEFEIPYQAEASLKHLTQAIYQYLLDNHAQGFQTLLLIDEAQHLSAEVLEQLRLLTNLETDSQKLLRVLLIGQPELQHKLQTEQLRQLAQRVTGRYHLLPLTQQEVAQYIEFRLQVAGCRQEIFSPKAVKVIAKQTQGVPRLINLVCDKCMLSAYYNGMSQVDGAIAVKASHDVMEFQLAFCQSSSAPPTAAMPIVDHSSPMIGHYAHPVKPNRLPYVLSLLLGAMLAFASYVYFPALLQLANAALPQVSQSALVAQVTPTVVENESVATSPNTDVEMLGPKSVPTLSIDQQVEQLISPLIYANQNPALAMQRLLRVWGYQASIEEANCRNAERGQLYCLQNYGQLNDIININRPAILTLQHAQQTFFAVLFHVDGHNVQLLLGQQRIQVPVEWLQQHWSGEYRLLWHSELVGKRLLLHAQGQHVVQLNRLLSQVLGEPASSSTVFDQQLKRRVEAFQMWQGIDVDGIAGNQTLMLLDTYVNRDAPTIRTTSLVSSGFRGQD